MFDRVFEHEHTSVRRKRGVLGIPAAERGRVWRTPGVKVVREERWNQEMKETQGLQCSETHWKRPTPTCTIISGWVWDTGAWTIVAAWEVLGMLFSHGCVMLSLSKHLDCLARGSLLQSSPVCEAPTPPSPTRRLCPLQGQRHLHRPQSSLGDGMESGPKSRRAGFLVNQEIRPKRPGEWNLKSSPSSVCDAMWISFSQYRQHPPL